MLKSIEELSESSKLDENLFSADSDRFLLDLPPSSLQDSKLNYKSDTDLGPFQNSDLSSPALSSISVEVPDFLAPTLPDPEVKPNTGISSNSSASIPLPLPVDQLFNQGLYAEALERYNSSLQMQRRLLKRQMKLN